MLALNEIEIKIGMKEPIIKVTETGVKDVAIIGMAFKLPLADDSEQFWGNLANGRDCLRVLPPGRKEDADRFLCFTGKSKEEISYWEMGYLNEIDKFDYHFFKLSPQEASLMDPNQRLFLETTWAAIEDAGYGGKKLVGSRTGVYLGHSQLSGDYLNMIRSVDSSLLVQGMAGNIPAIIASRISYLLDFRGPSIRVDTTCSSSLVALHLACQGLRSGECDYAIAGGINISILPVNEGLKVGIEASDNRTKTFDDSSDGTGSGEGVVALLLKPLSKARMDRDSIYAVIKGSAINQDGASIGITAPNPEAQAEVIVKAWQDAQINPETITYIEVHGTGTKLGDPIEIDGINRAFEKYTSKKQFCGLSALKTNIGHLDSTSGLAGVVKAVLAIKKGIIPPIIHFQMPNRKINFEHSPVYVNDILKVWNTGEFPKRCGVSAFGLSGTNCHVVLEETAPSDMCPNKTVTGGNEVLTLSAKSDAALKQLIRRYVDFFEAEKDPELENICYTANTGRGHYEYRIALIINTQSDVLASLKKLDEEFCNIGNSPGMYYSHYSRATSNAAMAKGYVKDLNEVARRKIQQFIKTNKNDQILLGEICELYINGADINWDSLYEHDECKRVRIPVYPFERTRCWVNIPDLQRISFNQLNIVKLSGRENEIYSEMENTVGQTWGDILGLKGLDITESFYEYGGDSIIAMKIVNRLSAELNVKMEVTDLLKTLTIEKMSAAIKKRLALQNDNGKHYPTIPKLEAREYYPLSSAQKRMFITYMMEGTSTSYNIFGACDIKGNLDPNKLQNVFNQLIERHETLRTSFELVNGIPFQRIHQNVKLNMVAKQISEENIQTELAAFIQPFDLSKSPLLRVCLFSYGKQSHVLAYDMHHIVSDGFSIGILVNEFKQLYDGEKLFPISIQYKDFSVWQNGFLESAAIKPQEKYWLSIFNDPIPVLQLPVDFNGNHGQNFKGDRVDIYLETSLTNQLKRMAINFETTLYNVLLAAYYILLLKYTDQEDMIVGTPIAGRQNKALENIIGMFVNMLAIRNCPSKGKKFSVFLNEVKNNSNQAFENQDYQFEMLVAKLGLARDANKGLLFNTVFALQNLDLKPLEIEGLTISEINNMTISVPYPLMLVAVEAEDGLELKFEYQTVFFKRSTVEKIAAGYTEIVRQIVEEGDPTLGEMSISNGYVKANSVLTETECSKFEFE